MRYNLLHSQICSIQIPCNVELEAGDVIEIELETASDNKDLGQFDETQSGKYIILHLCHHFDEKRSVTALTLVRDTYGRRKEMRREETNFFGDGLKFWIGKVVSKKAQKLQLDGKGWGWRYKVRIFGTYSEQDNVPDEQVHNATVLFGVTDGSGFAGRLKSCKISQYDIVFGFFMAEDEGYPVIIGLLSPTKAYNKFVESKLNGGSGFNKENTETQNGKQEFSEQNQINTASVNADDKNRVGSGEGLEVNESLVNDQLGDDINNQQTNAIPNPTGFPKF